MNDERADKLIAVLERIADSLEKLNKQVDDTTNYKGTLSINATVYNGDVHD